MGLGNRCVTVHKHDGLVRFLVLTSRFGRAGEKKLNINCFFYETEQIVLSLHKFIYNFLRDQNLPQAML